MFCSELVYVITSYNHSSITSYKLPGQPIQKYRGLDAIDWNPLFYNTTSFDKPTRYFWCLKRAVAKLCFLTPGVRVMMILSQELRHIYSY